MIRLIRIGDQILEGEEDFAFWDTVHDCFVSIDGDIVWHSRKHFEESCSHHANKTGNDIVYGGFYRLRRFLDSAAEGQPGGWVRQEDPPP